MKKREALNEQAVRMMAGLLGERTEGCTRVAEEELVMLPTWFLRRVVAITICAMNDGDEDEARALARTIALMVKGAGVSRERMLEQHQEELFEAAKYMAERVPGTSIAMLVGMHMLDIHPNADGACQHLRKLGDDYQTKVGDENDPLDDTPSA